MPADENEVKTHLANELAKERNRAAYDRTLMAWIRTAISLIAFGFAIAKSYEYIQMDEMEKTGRFIDQIHAPLWFGMSFVVLGMVSILGRSHSVRAGRPGRSSPASSSTASPGRWRKSLR